MLQLHLEQLSPNECGIDFWQKDFKEKQKFLGKGNFQIEAEKCKKNESTTKTANFGLFFNFGQNQGSCSYKKH